MILKIIFGIVFFLSIILGIHNALLYHPSNGFDGYGHMEYVDFIAKNWKLPPPTAWETHQAPLYYLISGGVQLLFKTQKAVQFLNIFVLWLIILVVALAIKRVLKNIKSVTIGVLSLAALPILNIFTPTITNELLSTFFIISSIVSGIYLSTSKSHQEKDKYFGLLLLFMALGVWTKVSMIAILPVLIFSLFLSYNFKTFFFKTVVLVVLFALSYLPIYVRASGTESPSNIALVATSMTKISRPADFFYRLDWIPKADMYTTQYYSLLGGAFNSFFTDGHNVITPFVPFHKKSFILWCLGFVLLPFSLYGQFKIVQKYHKPGLIIIATGILMILLFIYYNIGSTHYSSVRLTYEMAIVIPYAFGLAYFGQNKKTFFILTSLLFIQFITLVSFFWIEPWWFVTSPKKL